MNLEQIKEAAAIINGTSNSGYRFVESTNNSRDYLKKLLKAQEVWNEYKRSGTGKRYFLQETAMRGDYPLLFADNLAREMRARYSEFPADWRQVCNIATLPDFREKKIFPRGTLDQSWTLIPDGGPQPALTKTLADQTPITYSVSAYGIHTAINFQTIINDELGAFANIASDMAVGARRTELKLFTQSHFTTTGPTGLTQLTSNPVLNVAGFRAAWAQIRKSVDANGEPIMLDAPILEVGAGPLETTAREIIKAVALQIHDDLTAAGTAFNTENWISTMISNIIVNPYIPVVCSSNEDTSWCLLARSSAGSAAIEAGYLAGYEQPSLLQKASDTIVAGGGDIPLNRFGNFATNDVEFKGIHMVGFVVRDSKLGFMSNGTGS